MDEGLGSRRQSGGVVQPTGESPGRRRWLLPPLELFQIDNAAGKLTNRYLRGRLGYDVLHVLHPGIYPRFESTHSLGHLGIRDGREARCVETRRYTMGRLARYLA